MIRAGMTTTLGGAMLAGLIAAPAQATFGFFWDYTDNGGNIVNHLRIVSDEFDGFTAQLVTDGSVSVQNVAPGMIPGYPGTPGGSESYFAGGTSFDPLLAGKAINIGGSTTDPNVAVLGSGGIDATWIPDFDNGQLLQGGLNDPIAAGQFRLSTSTNAEYTIRINNAGDDGEVGDAIIFSGDIIDGRFQQRLPGDANLDAVVDVLDLDALSQGFGVAGNVVTGDFNGDGIVDVLDLDVLSQNFNNSVGGGTRSGLAAVPEPGSLALLGLGGLALLRRRRA